MNCPQNERDQNKQKEDLREEQTMQRTEDNFKEATFNSLKEIGRESGIQLVIKEGETVNVGKCDIGNPMRRDGVKQVSHK